MRIKTGKFIAVAFIIGLVLLTITDLIYPSKGENVNRLVPQAGRALMFLFMIISIAYLSFKFIKIPKSPILFVSIIFLLYTIISYLLRIDYVGTNFMSFVKTAYWVLGFLLVYILSYNGFISERHLYYFIIPSVALFFLIILRDFSNVTLFRGSKEYFVSNNGYNLLRFFPYVFLIRKNSIKISLIFVIGMGVILSLKRGTMLAFIVASVVIYFILLFSKKENIRVSKVGLLVVGIIVSAMFSYAILSNLETILHRLQDLENIETAGSGRGRMYGLIINEMLFQSNVFRFFFGYGFLATIQFFDTSIGHPIVAHSDLLELFYDYGLFGLLIFTAFFSSINKLRKNVKKQSYSHWLALTVWLIIISMSSIYSVNLFSPEMIYSIFMVAYIQGKNIRRHKNEK